MKILGLIRYNYQNLEYLEEHQKVQFKKNLVIFPGKFLVKEKNQVENKLPSLYFD